MQEILQTIAVEEKNPIGFEAALRQAKVSYRPWMLHYSKYDVSYLLGINPAGVVFQKTNGSFFIGKSQVRKIESSKK